MIRISRFTSSFVQFCTGLEACTWRFCVAILASCHLFSFVNCCCESVSKLICRKGENHKIRVTISKHWLEVLAFVETFMQIWINIWFNSKSSRKLISESDRKICFGVYCISNFDQNLYNCPWNCNRQSITLYIRNFY